MQTKHPRGFSKAAVYLKVVLCCTAFIGMAGCEHESAKNSDSSLTAFSVSGVIRDGDAQKTELERKFTSAGLIKGTDITVIVPWETNTGELSVFYTKGDPDYADFSSSATTRDVKPKADDFISADGSSSVTATYYVTAEDGGQTTYNVTVIPSRLQSIEVTKLPSKVTYIEGETDMVAVAGIEVTGTYSSDDPFTVKTPHTVTMDSTKAESLYSVGKFDKNRVGTQTVVVSIEDKTATFPITVAAKNTQVKEVKLSPKPTKETYTRGEELELNGMKVEVIYLNDHSVSDMPSETDDLKGYKVSGYNPQIIGNQTITVALGDKHATFDVTVNEYKPDLSLNINIGIDQNHSVKIFGIPTTGGIVLSAYGDTPANPKEIVLSTTGYTGVKWYIDGVPVHQDDNIITVKGESYTLEIPHTITFVGTKDGRTYSESISFKVKP